MPAWCKTLVFVSLEVFPVLEANRMKINFVSLLELRLFDVSYGMVTTE
jgi:hypothetical protein